MPKVTMYTKTHCPYCDMAKNLLRQRGVTQFEEISIEDDEQARNTMLTLSKQKTVPQIFIGDIHIGGFSDLKAKDQQGELQKLLNT